MSAGIMPSPLAFGPSLEHLGDNIGLEANVTVHVKGLGDLFGLTLERALYCIELFKEPGRTRILKSLPYHYNIPARLGRELYREGITMYTNQLCATAPAGRRVGLEPAPPLNEGEHYAGFILLSDVSAAHHLILLSGDVDVATWRQAEAFAVETGGALPDLCELELLYLNLKDQFKPECYWSNEVIRFGGDDVDSMMYQSFADVRYIDFAPDAEPMRARAIRRVPIEGPHRNDRRREWVAR